MTAVINVANDFSRLPYGRYRWQGNFSGEAFREDLLLPAMRSGDSIIVDLDGTSGVGPSFLEEAFGGLIRAGLKLDQVLSKLTIKSDDDPSYVEEVEGYLREEAARG